MTDEQTFLGRGWAFPPTFSTGGGQVAMANAEQDVHESIRIILGTRPTERTMRPAFGCDLHSLMFEEVNVSLETRIKQLVTDALLYNEPRIDLEGVDVNEQADAPGLLHIRVTYRIRATNSRFNLVYPFYLNEANRPAEL